MKLIDKDYAVDTAWSIEVYHGSAREVCEMLEDAPTVDAVPVIRCKDCKYFKMRSTYRHGLCDVHCNGIGDMEVTSEEDFCSWAERKDVYVTLHHDDIHFKEEESEKAFYEAMAERKEE